MHVSMPASTSLPYFPFNLYVIYNLLSDNLYDHAFPSAKVCCKTYSASAALFISSIASTDNFGLFGIKAKTDGKTGDVTSLKYRQVANGEVTLALTLSTL